MSGALPTFRPFERDEKFDEMKISLTPSGSIVEKGALP
jgi:hypothetical protein